MAGGLDREVEVGIKTRGRRKGHGNQGVGVGAGSEKNTEGEDLTATADLHEGKRAGPDQDLERGAKVEKDLSLPLK